MIVLSGCRGGTGSLFPLGPGKVWQYQVTSGLTSSVQEVKVVGPTSVGAFGGWSLRGGAGESRLAWAGSRLVAAELSGTTYNPPLPLFDPESEAKPVEWSGKVDAGYGAKAITATVTNKKAKETVGSRTIDVTMVDVKFSNGDEALMWLAPGIGVVRQEQRRADRLAAKLVYLSGP